MCNILAYVFSILIQTLVQGPCFCQERSERFVVNGNGVEEMDFAAEIVKLKQQMVQQTTEIESLRQQVVALEMNKGTTYIRWGRSACSGNGTSTVYSGYMAGTHFQDQNTGSGANYLCLPDHPTWGHYTDGMQNGIRVTGVEYNFNPHQHSDLVDFFGENVYGAEAPCAICHIERGASIMIPGRTQCFSGWTEEYAGYLATSYPLYDDSSEYVCIDKRPEMVTNTGTFHGKNELYLVEAQCGFDLECPPYVDGRELACVVCSK